MTTTRSKTLETGKVVALWLFLRFFEAAGVVGVLSAGSLSDTFGRRRILLLSLIGAPASLFLFTAVSGWFGLAALALVGFTLLSTTPVMLAMVQEHAKSSPSAANGFFMMISFIARSAVVVVVGFGGDQIGLKSAYFLCALLGSAAVPFVLKLPRGAIENRSARR
jgi:MFS transporter, FSR family, fosmidomycin resistance protein